jgi:hypothetical protein
MKPGLVLRGLHPLAAQLLPLFADESVLLSLLIHHFLKFDLCGLL